MTTGNGIFELQKGSGWRRGLDNLLRAEFGRWWKTRMWWVQILIWTGMINLILFFIAISEANEPANELLMLFNIFLGLFGAIGVCIIMQGEIVGEKRSGTAAWILSKPTSRPAFVFAKLIGNTAGIAITIVLVQGFIAYLILVVFSNTTLQPVLFLGGLGVQMVNLLFYITLTLMLGVIFNHRAPVIAIPMVFLFVQQMVPGLVPELVKVLPWILTMPPEIADYPSIAMAVMTGTQAYSYLPVPTTLFASLIFVVVGVWAFNNQEF